jgi:hypothetical protein
MTNDTKAEARKAQVFCDSLRASLYRFDVGAHDFAALVDAVQVALATQEAKAAPAGDEPGLLAAAYMAGRRDERDCVRAALATHPAPQRAIPHPGSPEASAMIDSVLAEYGWPANTKNAARAGYVAAQRMLAAAPEASPQPVAQEGEPVAYVNRDELDNMLDDRTATIAGVRDGWRKTPLYLATPSSPQAAGRLTMADGSPFLDYLASAAPEDTAMDDWTRGYEECKRRLHRILSPQLAATPPAPAAEVQAGWKPIETAPKDGTHILCVTAGYTKRRIGWFFNGAWRWDGDYSGAHLAAPTHWMPLPAAPAQQMGEAKE